MLKDLFIEEPDQGLLPTLEFLIDNKIKPIGSLGKLEEVALKIGLIQQNTSLELHNPHIAIFAGDHGIVDEGVSAYPQDVTFQMVQGFLKGGTAIGTFARQHQINLEIIDAGVNHEFSSDLAIVHNKVGLGTRNYMKGPAMTQEELDLALEKGREVVRSIQARGCNVLGFGEMGIGNTAAASMIMSRICDLDIETCVGRGAGLDDEQLMKKIKVLKKVSANHQTIKEPLEVLQYFGGFEMAQMCGGMLEAAANKMLVLVDGFISTAAFLVAAQLFPAIKDYAILSHLSGENGHKLMAEHLGMNPLLDLNMRLGEGTGCAMAYPIVQSAVLFFNEMASFEQANVSQAT